MTMPQGGGQAPMSWQRPMEEVGPAPGLEFGSPGPRLVAWIVDGIIVAVVVTAIALFGVLVLVAGATNDNAASAVGGGLIIVFGAIVVSFGYFPWFWARSGATPGMRLFGLRVVRDADGGPISGGQAVLRLIGYWVSGAVFYLGYIWIFIDKRKRGWHDLIAGTVVVQQQ
ncbi:MAG TPA: RDD family protein [Candidatus Limnocylindrales bacterium]